MNRRQLQVIDYLREENRVLREQLGDRRLRLNDHQRRRLAAKAKVLGRKVLDQIATIVTPETLLAWHRKLIAQKYGGTAHRTPGRPHTAGAIESLVAGMAEENRDWRYRRIQGARSNLGHELGRSTISQILEQHGIEPAPERIRVQIAGFVSSANGLWMSQIARNLTDAEEGILTGKRYLIQLRPSREGLHRRRSSWSWSRPKWRRLVRSDEVCHRVGRAARQDPRPVERRGGAGSGRIEPRPVGVGVIQITPQMRMLVAIEPVDGRCCGAAPRCASR
jgi:hypothetical protein